MTLVTSLSNLFFVSLCFHILLISEWKITTFVASDEYNIFRKSHQIRQFSSLLGASESGFWFRLRKTELDMGPFLKPNTAHNPTQSQTIDGLNPRPTANSGQYIHVSSSGSPNSQQQCSYRPCNTLST